jgi:hypothetical protein
MARQRYFRRLARYRNTLRVSADPVAKPAAHTRAESRGSRPSKAAAGERLTVCWREPDSNPRSLSGMLPGPPHARLPNAAQTLCLGAVVQERPLTRICRRAADCVVRLCSIRSLPPRWLLGTAPTVRDRRERYARRRQLLPEAPGHLREVSGVTVRLKGDGELTMAARAARLDQRRLTSRRDHRASRLQAPPPNAAT